MFNFIFHQLLDTVHMTPISTAGLFHHTIASGAPYGLPLHLKTLPNYLSQLHYKSHHVGKWHLGFYRSTYTPTARGFSSHTGYWAGMQDYYDHTIYTQHKHMVRVVLLAKYPLSPLSHASHFS